MPTTNKRPTTIYDFLAITGTASLGLGLWLITPTLCFIILGILFICAGIVGHLRGAE